MLSGVWLVVDWGLAGGWLADWRFIGDWLVADWWLAGG